MSSHFNGPLAVGLRRLLNSGAPDPWSPEDDARVREVDAVPLCLHCLSPQMGHQWFCPHCGFPTGEYVPTMPFLNVFLEGEFFVRGVSGSPEKSRLKIVALAGFALCSYNFFAPIYWYRMAQKQKGKPIHEGRRHEPEWKSDGAEPGATDNPGDA